MRERGVVVVQERGQKLFSFAKKKKLPWKIFIGARVPMRAGVSIGQENLRNDDDENFS